MTYSNIYTDNLTHIVLGILVNKLMKRNIEVKSYIKNERFQLVISIELSGYLYLLN